MFAIAYHLYKKLKLSKHYAKNKKRYNEIRLKSISTVVIFKGELQNESVLNFNFFIKTLYQWRNLLLEQKSSLASNLFFFKLPMNKNFFQYYI